MSDKIKPSEVSQVLLDQLKGISNAEKFDEVGTVLTVSDGVARIYGLRNAEANELLEFENGTDANAYCYLGNGYLNDYRILMYTDFADKVAVAPGKKGYVTSNIRDEDIDDAAKRVLRSLTGLHDLYMRQVGAFGSVHRDSGNRVVSIAYFALVDIDNVSKELNYQNSAYWEDVDHLPHLLFDHMEMINKALLCLRTLVPSRPVGFHLLPPLFTLTQLQQLYEAILGETIDKRNFRKRINEMPFIEKTEEIDRKTSKRGAILYRFNQLAYQDVKMFKL